MAIHYKGMTTHRRFVFTGLIFGSCLWLSCSEARANSSSFLKAKSELASANKVFESSLSSINLFGSDNKIHRAIITSFVDILGDTIESAYLALSNPRPYRSVHLHELHVGLSPP